MNDGADIHPTNITEVSSVTTDQIAHSLHRIVKAAGRRTELEQAIEQEYAAANRSAERDRGRAMREVESRFELENETIEADAAERRHQLEAERQSETSRLKSDYQRQRSELLEQAERREQAARKQWAHEIWLTESEFESVEPLPKKEHEQAIEAIERTSRACESIRAELHERLVQYRQRRVIELIDEKAAAAAESIQSGLAGNVDARAELDAALESARSGIETIRRMFTARLFVGATIFVLSFLFSAMIVGAVAATTGELLAPRTGYAAGGAIVLIILLDLLLYRFARRRLIERGLPVRCALDRAAAARERALEQATDRRRREEQANKKRHDDELETAKRKYAPIIAEVRDHRRARMKELKDHYPRLIEEANARCNAELDLVDSRRQARKREADEQRSRDLAGAEAACDHARGAAKEQYESRWANLATTWARDLQAFRDVIESTRERSARVYPDWDDASWSAWSHSGETTSFVRFGGFHVDLATLPGGLPADPRLRIDEPTVIDVPALVTIPDRGSLLIETPGDGRAAAIEAMQLLMLRLLIALPPGKARFTIIDPVGLGQSFAAFMHLADYSEALVNDRIWTDPRHIEQRLADMTEHMESVIQKYLRNDFATIAEYNERAGEIAEPYRFLVIADCPTNLTESAAKRLMSIVNSGVRCGVYTIISFDHRQKPPPGLHLDDLRKASVRLMYENGGLIWKDERIERWPLRIDPMPDAETLTRLLHEVGRASLDSSRVQAPFALISPGDGRVWTKSSSAGLDVPLGRAGATKLQPLRLGEGTLQHGLIAGKTGSGKSTLLHVIITNTALWYSPAEVELYLVDFKKGVEFKPYVTHDLPHARAVAIESDREFGISILERVDAELKRRGAIFRDAGAQDLASFRRLHPDTVMPRTLLVIDEFQEFFTEDDRIAQEAALLLDRLVRQGRAFGVHVLLGSQTLGGAYGLAQSTIGQMAVRIALQCSDTDAYLILDEDNTAARLLSRPGEAIYNDASGLVGGNNPFQICWLSESERLRALKRMRIVADERQWRRHEPLIVFEGNAPADLRRNLQLESALERDVWPAKAPTTPQAWLGDPVAIRDPVAAAFRRQNGSHLLIVGQQEDAALAMQISSMISLAAQLAPDSSPIATAAPQFSGIDATPPESPGAGSLERLARSLPHSARAGGWRDAAAIVTAVAAELDRRQSANEIDAPPIFLLIHGLHRLRDLRSRGDDFGYSLDTDPEAPPTPDRALAAILRDGGAFGVHCIIWIDSATSMDRSLERQAIREFDMRLLFQMSAGDSSNLIDSGLASKLGVGRALLYSDERGAAEKFRPYAMPDRDWLETVAERLSHRADVARA